MSVAARPPTCRWVRNPVHATCTYANPPAARPGVSSTCSTPACPSSSRTRSMNGPSRAAASPRTPATNPTEQPTPSRSQSSLAARPTGTWLATVRLAAWANTPGPYWTRPLAPAPGAPVGGAHHGAVRVADLGQGDARRAGLLAGPAPRPAPQRPVPRLARRLGVGAVGAGRLAGVGRVPGCLVLQLGDPVSKAGDLRIRCRHLRPQLSDQHVPCRQLGLVQLGLGSDHRPRLGVDRTLPPRRRAQLLHRQAGQVTRRLGHARDDRHVRSRRSTRSAHDIRSSCRRSPRPRSPSLNSYRRPARLYERQPDSKRQDAACTWTASGRESGKSVLSKAFPRRSRIRPSSPTS